MCKKGEKFDQTLQGHDLCVDVKGAIDWFKGLKDITRDEEWKS